MTGRNDKGTHEVPFLCLKNEGATLLISFRSA